MRLLSLELQGFKSFPDKTRIQFDRGVTVIVGPNGSGKSNISDAIRWVLGEISSKNIRGTKMEDVIFGGSDKRSPMGFAEVSLTIDNRDTENRLPLEYEEVTVTRRYYRTSGDSEYLINRKPVRLKDITEIFMNTGIGRSGYSMINQGKSTEIISQKSDERRNIFEEAAGISKYRYKKNEAQRKLSETEDNLTRVNDILGELTARVVPLEREAERAKRYLELFERKKEADVSLWLYEISSVRSRSEEIERAYAIARHELEMAEDTLQSLESQSERLFAEKQENSRIAEQLARRIEDAKARKFELEGSSLVLRNDITHLESQIAEAEAAIRIGTTALEETAARGAACAVRFEEEQAAKAQLLRQKEAGEAECAALELEVAAAGDRIDENYAVTERLQGELVELKVRLSALESSSRSTEERRSALQGELEQYRQTLQLCRERMSKGERSLAEYTTRKEEFNAQLAALDQEAIQASENRERLVERQTQYRIDINTGRQRIDTLRRMEEHFEGYAQSVRAVMTAAESGKLSGIYAPISRILHVEPQYSTALETALGANLQNIVVADEAAAKSAIAYLKATNAGRSTFYPLTSVRGQSLDRSEFTQFAGFLGIADSIVQFDSKFAPVIRYLLGKTVIFDTLEHATVMAKATGYRTRAVTLDGQIINAGGSFTGGSSKRDSGMLTRGAEIARTEREIARREEEKAKCDGEIAALSELLEKSKRERAELNSKFALLNSMMQAENTQYQILTAQYKNDEAHLDSLMREWEQLDRTGAEYLTERDAILEREKAATVELQEAQERDASFTQAESDCRKAFTLRKEALSALILQLALKEKDLETAAAACRTAQETQAAQAEQVERAKRTLAVCRDKAETARSTVTVNAGAAADVDREIQSMQEERSNRILSGEQFEKRESDLKSLAKDRTDHRDKLFKEYTRLESAKQQLLEEQDKMAARMWEEYNLTFSTAAELAYPPVTEETKGAVTQTLNECKNKMRSLGSVNVGAIEEYKEVKERFDFLSTQVNDLTASKTELSETIFRLEKEMRIRFLQVMEDINRNFQTVFTELFGGGHAELVLTEPDNVLESGIEINVAPPGKIIKKLSLLSGGEQSFVAIALLFAILNVNPTPFCVLDEVEAALDEVNVERVADYAKRYAQTTQLIFITHRRGTMEAADMLYGVTMAERGISKVLSLNVSEAEQKIGVKL